MLVLTSVIKIAALASLMVLWWRAMRAGGERDSLERRFHLLIMVSLALLSGSWFVERWSLPAGMVMGVAGVLVGGLSLGSLMKITERHQRSRSNTN